MFGKNSWWEFHITLLSSVMNCQGFWKKHSSSEFQVNIANWEGHQDFVLLAVLQGQRLSPNNLRCLAKPFGICIGHAWPHGLLPSQMQCRAKTSLQVSISYQLFGCISFFQMLPIGYRFSLTRRQLWHSHKTFVFYWGGEICNTPVLAFLHILHLYQNRM